jgi:spore cortex formation protein SpoVR/YcgB (stage V sporulation)
LLQHHHDGRDLQLAHAGETLKNVARMWKKNVHLLTQEEGAGRKLTSDGKELKSVETQLESAKKPIEAV